MVRLPEWVARPATETARQAPDAARQTAEAAPRAAGWATPGRLVALAAAYMVFAWVGTQLHAHNELGPVWPAAAGLALAALVASPPRRWAAVLATLAAANLATSLVGGQRPVTAVAFAAAAALEALVGALVVRRLDGGRTRMRTVRGVLALLGGAAAGPAVGALAGTAVAVNLLDVDQSVVFAAGQWLVRDAAGIVVLTPLLLGLRSARAPERLRLEPVAMAATFVASVVLVLVLPRPGMHLAVLSPFLVMPVLIWAAVRANPVLTHVFNLGYLAALVFASAQGIGPFGAGSGISRSDSAAAAQLSCLVLVVTTLVLSAATTERTDAGAQLQEAHQAMQHIDEGVLRLDAADRIAWCNKPLLAMLAKPSWAVLGHGLLDVLRLTADADLAKVQVVLAAAREEGWGRCQVGIPGPEGGLRAHELSLVAHGEAGIVHGVLRDVADEAWSYRERVKLIALEREARTRVEEANGVLAEQLDTLRTLDRMREDLVATVSHELRTPMTAINGAVEMVLDGDGGELTGGQEHLVQVIHRANRRLLRLVDDLLFVSRIEDRGLQIAAEPVDVASVVRHAAEAAQAAGRVRGLEVRASVRPAGEVLVRGDADRLGQVVDNLVSNAVKFTLEGSVVIGLDTDARAGEALLTVTDTGPGIAAGDLEHVTERFFRGRSAVDGAVPGVGIGLSIVTAIVAAHGGRMDLQSEVGVGTTVSVHLPLLVQAVARTPVPLTG